MNGKVGDLLAGAMIGLSIAVPVGPMAVLCINCTLAQGVFAGISTGAGASTIHAGYCAILLAGLHQVGPWLNGNRLVMNLLGAALMLLFAWRLLRSHRRVLPDGKPRRQPLLLAYASAVAFNLTNPMTVLLLTGSVASIVGPRQLDRDEAMRLLAGTFAGSVAWWACLSGSAAVLRHRLSAPTLKLVNDLAAVAMVGFATWALIRACTQSGMA